MAVTLRFQSTGAVPGNGLPVTMRGDSLTIGRGAENDLVLPDPDRQISKVHCVIEAQRDRIVAFDLSTNGTFLNYAKLAMGRGATQLNDGDVLSMGAYELVVSITELSAEDLLMAPLADMPGAYGDAARAPDPMKLLDDAGPGGDFLDALLGSPTPKGPKQLKIPGDDFAELLPPLGDEGPLLGPRDEGPVGPAMPDHGASASDAFRAPSAERAVIPDDWEDLLAPAPVVARPSPFITRPPYTDAPSASAALIPDDALIVPPVASPPDARSASPFAEPVEEPTKVPEPLVPPVPEPIPPMAVVAPPTPASPGGDSAARAFLLAAGAEEVRITDADLMETMARMGRVMRAMVTGLREILMTRTSIKSEFRIDQTMVNVGGNNPLKFSVSPEQAIEAMVRPTARGYLPAEMATAQALDDIKAHEVAMVTGMEAALKGVLARLDPASLTEKIEATGGIGGFLKGRKAQYWETYEKIYADIADQAQNDFHDLFAREFAAAYKEQLARLKAAKE